MLVVIGNDMFPSSVQGTKSLQVLIFISGKKRTLILKKTKNVIQTCF